MVKNGESKQLWLIVMVNLWLKYSNYLNIYIYTYPVGGWPTPLEKYETQLGLLFPIYGKIQNVWSHQPGTTSNTGLRNISYITWLIDLFCLHWEKIQNVQKKKHASTSRVLRWLWLMLWSAQPSNDDDFQPFFIASGVTYDNENPFFLLLLLQLPQNIGLVWHFPFFWCTIGFLIVVIENQ